MMRGFFSDIMKPRQNVARIGNIENFSLHNIHVFSVDFTHAFFTKKPKTSTKCSLFIELPGVAFNALRLFEFVTFFLSLFCSGGCGFYNKSVSGHQGLRSVGSLMKAMHLTYSI